MNLKDYIAIVEGFPKEGISFKDITPLMENGEAYRYTIDEMARLAAEMGAQIIVSPESRGFLFGCPVATKLGLGFVPVRKKGKLPRATKSIKYDLEYGQDELFIHADAIKPGQKVVIIDDIVAIGGTLNAAAKLVQSLQGEVVGMIALIGLKDLPGLKLLAKYNLKALIVD